MGAGWAEPLLGQLLEDPYSAIRCLADRSLRQAGASAPAGYDYTIPPPLPGLGMQSARETVWKRWRSAATAMESGLSRRVLLAAPDRLSEAFAPWLGRRDARPMRLRE